MMKSGNFATCKFTKLFLHLSQFHQGNFVRIKDRLATVTVKTEAGKPAGG